MTTSALDKSDARIGACEFDSVKFVEMMATLVSFHNKLDDNTYNEQVLHACTCMHVCVYVRWCVCACGSTT